jgi:CsoR family transcriptional regulator, copper-sensing transcriptional repressor
VEDTVTAITLEDDKKLLDRLARVEGQVRGLRKMLEDGRNCEDVLTQLLAVRSGLEPAGLLILDRHLSDCVLADPTISADAIARVRETLRLWSRHG